MAESIWAHLVRHSHPTALAIPDPQCRCSTLYQIHHPLRNPLRSDGEYPRHHSNHRCPKCFQVRYHPCFWLAFGWFSALVGHLRLQFLLQGGPLQTKLVAKVTIWQCKWSLTIMLKEWQWSLDDHFRVRIVSYVGRLRISSARFLPGPT